MSPHLRAVPGAGLALAPVCPLGHTLQVPHFHHLLPRIVPRVQVGSKLAQEGKGPSGPSARSQRRGLQGPQSGAKAPLLPLSQPFRPRALLAKLPGSWGLSPADWPWTLNAAQVGRAGARGCSGPLLGRLLSQYGRLKGSGTPGVPGEVARGPQLLYQQLCSRSCSPLPSATGAGQHAGHGHLEEAYSASSPGGGLTPSPQSFLDV